MIDEMLKLAAGSPAYVFISSAKDSLIPSKMKKEYLTKMLTRDGKFPKNLTLVDTAECEKSCGGPLGGWGYLKDKGIVGPSVTLVVGSDQAPKFDPKTARMWGSIEEAERPSIRSIERGGSGVTGYSSTKAREAVAASGAVGLIPFLTDGVNEVTGGDLERMAKKLLDVQSKWKGGAEEEESVMGAVDGGSRQNKA
jgi:hypothetical protein